MHKEEWGATSTHSQHLVCFGLPTLFVLETYDHQEPLVASLLLVVWPRAPSSVLAPSSDALCS